MTCVNCQKLEKKIVALEKQSRKRPFNISYSNLIKLGGLRSALDVARNANKYDSDDVMEKASKYVEFTSSLKINHDLADMLAVYAIYNHEELLRRAMNEL